MKIDQRELHELFCMVRKPCAKDERFYAIPNAKEYALSTYCRLLHRKHDSWYEVVVPIGEYYLLQFDDKQGERKINIGTLAAKVFFPKIENGYLYPFKSGYGWRKWKVEKLHLIVGREMMVEALSAKMSKRSPNYGREYKSHIFINRWEPTRYKHNFNKYLHRYFWNMKVRSTNKGYKKRFSAYEETAVCEEWSNNAAIFKQWFLDNQYHYKGQIQVDKDILGFGKTNKYAPDLCCLVPRHINSIFEKSSSQLGYSMTKIPLKNGESVYEIRRNAFGGIEHNIRCASYMDALKTGRRLKANNIRNVVAKEREKGNIPSKILDCMLRWADLAEMGLIEIWEPSQETLMAEGIYNNETTKGERELLKLQ